MPFSSPTAEEILSPVPSNFSHNSPQPWRKNGGDSAGRENTHSRTKSSLQKPPKRESSRRQARNQNKSRWPGLNVVTNFSKSPILTHRAADAATQHNRKKESRAQNVKPGFVTLSDVKPPIDNKGERGFKTHRRNKSSGGTLRSDLELRNHDEKSEKSIYSPKEEATGLGLQHYGDPPDYDACLLSDSMDRLNRLKPSPTKITELSPSDGPIVIGISIPSAKLAEHAISPEAGPTPSTPRRYTTHRDAPPTPTIIVTPARDDEPWSAAFGDRNEVSSSRRRVASSIYSRATHYGQRWTPPADIPPVPVRPQEYVSAKPDQSKNLPDDHVRGLGPRVDSNDTLFDEDNQVTTSNINRSVSEESQSRILQPPRINTTGRRHASQGWWNYVLSPFTARSNTMMFRGDSPKSAGSIPTISSPKSETATSHGQPVQLPTRFSSPVIEESIGTRIDCTNLKRDHSGFENERHNTGLVFDHTPSIGEPSAFNSPTSFDGFGAAAEYYNACWHDQNSPTPYFDCQNHSCLPSTRENFPAPDDPVKDIEDSDVVRDLADNKSNGQAPSGFHQTPTNRFSAAFSQANRSKPRPLSEATDIEDLDETPVVREAYVAPVVHAGAPITAGSTAGASTNASPMVSSSANAPNTTILNTITLNNHYPYAAPTKDAVSPSAAQPSWLGSVSQPLSSSAASEQPREMVGSPQPAQPSSVQQSGVSAASSQRAHKKFVAVMPPDQASSTREAPMSSTPSFSSEPLYPKHSLPSGSALSSGQLAPSHFGAPEPPGISGPSKNYLFPESSSPTHPDYAASRPPVLYEPPVTSRYEESSNTVPSGPAVFKATPASYANSRALLSSEHMPSSGVPESSNFEATEISPPSSIINSKMPPSSNSEMSSKYMNTRGVTPSEPPMTSGNMDSRPFLPFDASMSSQPSRPSRPPLSSQPSLSPSTSFSSQHPLSSQLPASSHPELSYSTPLPQKPPVSSQSPFSHNTPTELLPSSSYAYSRAPPSEYRMSPENTNSGTLPSNYAAFRAPPPELSTFSAPPLSTEYTAPKTNASGPFSSTNATSRAPLSFEAPIASQPLTSSHTTASDPPTSSQAATSTLPISSGPLLSENVTSRGLASAEPMSSEYPSSGYMASTPAPSLEPPISSGPLMSSRYATSEPRSSDFTKFKAPPSVEPSALGPLLSSNNAASDAPPSSATLSSSRNMTSGPQRMILRTPSVAKLMRSEPPFASNYVESSVPPSSEPPLSSQGATSKDETAEFLPSSDYTSSRTLPFEPQISSGPEIFSGPQSFENGSSAPQARNFPRKAVPRNENLEDQTRSAPHTYVVNNYYDGSGSFRKGEQIPLEALYPPLDSGGRSGNSWEIKEKHYHRSPKRKARCYPGGKCFNRDKGRKSHMTKTKKRLLWGIAVSLVILIILILALVMTLTRKGDKLNVQSQWLNITGFPPIPTGISTIVQPDAVHETSSCVQPATMWSCAVPKEEQQSISPNDPDQPNFRIEIRFQNGTTSNSTTKTKNPSKRSQVPAFNPISATTSIRRRLLHVRDAFNSNLFSPSPSPPSEEDQVFLGNSTDKITAPFNGESTPFFISFLSASKLPQRRLLKRQRSQTGNITDPFPNLTEGIPPPDTNSDGTAASANLLPFPTAQPLRLYDRGLLTEHYGFYNYFDRSIFLKSTSLLNDTGPTTGDVPDDEDGGAEKSSATVRCTWRETRFLVQIWTNQAAASPLLGSANHTASGKNQPPKNLTKSTANDFVRPGSFPYPVTITLDRHGGDPNNKFIYCYGMDARGHIILDEKKIQLEDRASGGGVLVNPAQGLFSDANVTKAEGGPGGIDGGTGGCGCQWSNFGSA